jgi:hypothetical protein
VLTDFYSSIRELEKLAVYTKGKYVDLDMGGLTNLWITVLAPEAENRDRFVSIVFPGDIENIPNNCCDRMRNLRSIILPPGLVQIGERAFWECTRLENFTLPPGVTTIGEDAFWNCDRLTTVDLTNVTSIGTSAFYQCDSLQVAIVDKNEPPSMGSYVFGYWAASLSNDFAIYVPDESIEAYQTAPNWNFYHDVSGNTFDGTIINGWDVLRGRASAYIYQSRFKPLSELPEEYR